MTNILWFQKIPIPPQGGFNIGNSKGEGVSKASLEGKYEPKLQFLEGLRVQTKKPSVGGVGIFSRTTHKDQ